MGGEGRKKARFFLEVNRVLSSFAVLPKIFQKSPSPLSQRHYKDQVTPFPRALWSGNTNWLSSPASHFSALRSNPVLCSSVQFSRSVMSNSLPPHESQHAKPPCPSPTPGVHSDSRPLVGNAIQPSHPLSSPHPPAPNPSQHQSLFQ